MLMPESNDVIDVLEDIRRWVKIIGLQEAKSVLTEALSHDDEEKQRDLRITYYLTDGQHSVREIEEKISYTRGWVSSRYDDWSNMGLIERESPNSSYRHVVSLKEAGIEIPEPREPGDDAEDEEEADNGEVQEEAKDQEADIADLES